jgi:hypothetical protein
MSEVKAHFSADGWPVKAGEKFWDNNLQVVQITKMEVIPARPYADTGCMQTWHEHTSGITSGISDTLTGAMLPYGRLARKFEGRDATQYEPGTKFADT